MQAPLHRDTPDHRPPNYRTTDARCLLPLPKLLRLPAAPPPAGGSGACPARSAPAPVSWLCSSSPAVHSRRCSCLIDSKHALSDKHAWLAAVLSSFQLRGVWPCTVRPGLRNEFAHTSNQMDTLVCFDAPTASLKPSFGQWRVSKSLTDRSHGPFRFTLLPTTLWALLGPPPLGCLRLKPFSQALSPSRRAPTMASLRNGAGLTPPERSAPLAMREKGSSSNAVWLSRVEGAGEKRSQPPTLARHSTGSEFSSDSVIGAPYPS